MYSSLWSLGSYLANHYLCEPQVLYLTLVHDNAPVSAHSCWYRTCSQTHCYQVQILEIEVKLVLQLSGILNLCKCWPCNNCRSLQERGQLLHRESNVPTIVVFFSPMPCAPWRLRRSFKIAYYSHTTQKISLLREARNKQNNQTKQKNNQNQPKTTPKIEINAGETVKHRELVPLNASLICSPQWCSPFHTSLSNFPKQFCIGCIIRFWHVFLRRFWIF